MSKIVVPLNTAEHVASELSLPRFESLNRPQIPILLSWTINGSRAWWTLNVNSASAHLAEINALNITDERLPALPPEPCMQQPSFVRTTATPELDNDIFLRQ